MSTTDNDEFADSLRRLPGGLLGVARGLDKADSAMAWVERWLIVGCIFGMAIASIANVIGRNVFNYSLPFTEEIMQVLQIWLTFIGISYGARAGRHIRVTALVDALPELLRKTVLILAQLITCLLLAYLAYLAYGYVMSLAESKRVMPSLRWPLYILYSVVPAGLALGSVQFFLSVMRNLLSTGRWLSWKSPEVEAEDAEVDDTGI
ncbi:TRAP-type C4-dicarboxylate transport system, small permease component [Modicisalibacter ilicicola DSM 19980]|uniref:TRAP transporter small permease protein n=1 Tax=Modicisalibacter ilicicola DSM 19980 TaxID=1121942 RepID=A0A1M5AGE5_9GAMM|nr:TRAP transporter small permease [Halomonas ilicicola]SHF29217.1 TRAP-type C4-dicarboxylate transport system, small permease component [Halomonas ilicicola DSM 19980]